MRACLCRVKRNENKTLKGREGKLISHLTRCCLMSSQVLKPSSVATHTLIFAVKQVLIFPSLAELLSLCLTLFLSISLDPLLSLSLSWHNNFSLNSLTDTGFRLRAKVPNSFRSKLTLCDVLLDN